MVARPNAVNSIPDLHTMDISEVLHSIENTGVASSIRDSLYLFPMLESVHVIGLAIVFGTISIMDLRLLGLASTNRPFRMVASDILKWTWIAFAITFVTGGLMFSTNAAAYFHNSVFQAKMALLLLAGINMGIFELTTGRTAGKWGTLPSTPAAAKTAAVISLTLWIGVIFLGRWIGFTTSRTATQNEAPVELNLDELFPGAAEEPAAPAPPSTPAPGPGR
jgi:hypothetical protein